MDASERDEWVAKLRDFLDELKRYREALKGLGIVTIYGLNLDAAGEHRDEVEEMRERLLRASRQVQSVTRVCGVTLNLRPPFQNYIIRDYDVFSGALGTTTPHSGSIMVDLDKAVDLVNMTIGRLESTTPSPAGTIAVAPRRDSAKAFIAHGPATEALNKLCEFLDALGVKPLVVERLPSEGRSVNENVEHYLSQADCGIVLATGDDLVDGHFQPRGNVNIETGRFQERFGGRVIFLLEEGAAFPSNISEKVWARFSQSSMDEAFLEVVRELRAFGLL
jgi:predicted nucleotide-binding protein